VFDCTVDVRIPQALARRVKFFKVCLGDANFRTDDGREFLDWRSLQTLAQVPAATFMKMDIEGFEWVVLPNIIQSAAKHLSETGEDIFPSQIAFELHYLSQFGELAWSGRDKSAGEILAFFNYLFYTGGYLVSDRRDNSLCKHCTELVMIRALC